MRYIILAVLGFSIGLVIPNLIGNQIKTIVKAECIKEVKNDN
jgi:hypothetical protein